VPHWDTDVTFKCVLIVLSPSLHSCCASTANRTADGLQSCRYISEHASDDDCLSSTELFSLCQGDYRFAAQTSSSSSSSWRRRKQAWDSLCIREINVKSQIGPMGLRLVHKILQLCGLTIPYRDDDAEAQCWLRRVARFSQLFQSDCFYSCAILLHALCAYCVYSCC